MGGLRAWYKAESLSGVADGGSVVSWADSSGQGHNATAPSAAQRPSYVAGAVNGQGAVRFDGTDDLLQSAFTLAQPATVVVVYRLRTDTGTNQYVTDGYFNGSMILYDTPTSYGLYAGGGATLNKGGFTFGAFHVVAGVYAGANSLLAAEGGPAVTGNPGSATPGGITIGNSGAGAAPASADVAEVLVYDTAVARPDLDRLGHYLRDKYGVAWTDV